MTDRILAFIAALQRILQAIAGPVLDFIDQRQVVRRAMVLIVLWQLVDAYLWAKHFAYRDGMTGLELGAVIAAITGPVTVLQGFLFRMYDSSRNAPG
jgi:hypothetical protein